MVVCDICRKECKNEDFSALHIHSGKANEALYMVIDICDDCRLKIKDNRKRVCEIICKSIGQADLRIRKMY